MGKWKNRGLLVAPEATYGVAPSMDGADAIQVSEIDVTPIEVSLIDRELILGSLGNTEKVINGRMSKAQFKVELAGSGSVGVAPKWGSVMRACGFAETIDPGVSVTYQPVSTLLESAALTFIADGAFHVLRGCRGTWSLEGSSGGLIHFNFDLMGLYTEETEGALPSYVFSDQAKPVAMNAENTTPVSFHGQAACMESFSLDLANEVVFEDYAGCEQQVVINDRKPSGEVTVKQVSLATKNYFAALSNQALGTFSMQHGQTAGNICTLTMPAINIGGVGYANSQGSLMLKMPYMPNPDEGNDEISLVLT